MQEINCLRKERIEICSKYSVINVLLNPKFGRLVNLNNCCYYIHNGERCNDNDAFTISVDGEQIEYRVNIEDNVWNVASNLSTPAQLFLDSLENISKPDLLSKIYCGVSGRDIGEIKLQVRNLVLKRKASEYVVLNEVSAYTDIEQQIYQYPNYPSISISTPVNWGINKKPFNTRSWRYGFNAWVFMDSLLVNGSLEGLVFAKNLMLDWIDFNIVKRHENEFGWYDMGVAFRATRIPYLIDHCIRHDLFSDNEFYLVSIALKLHILDLSDITKLALHSNHGLYQLCGLLAISNMLPEISERDLYDSFAKYHFSQTVLKDVNSEGVHLEHSPDYHVYISDILYSAINAGWITDSIAIDRVNRMNSVNYMMLHPNNKAVRFGDTSERDFRSIINKNVPELFYVYRNGKEGVKPPVNNLVLPESGYAFFRDDWEKKPWTQCSYLACSGAFHKRTHKHADDFTFEWSELGKRIIIDAGKFGYEKNSIERQYVESTRAHNCVEIDEKDYSRFNHDIFGSAIEAYSEHDNIKLVEFYLNRKRVFKTEHRRTIIYSPGNWLLVIDHLNSKENHKFTQWFHFDPELKLERDIDSISLNLSDKIEITINSFSDNQNVEHLKAQFEPRLQGWTSIEPYQLTPNDALGFTVNDSKEHTFATLFSIGSIGQVITPISFKSKTNGKYLRVKWISPSGQSNDICYRISEGHRELTLNNLDIQVTQRCK